MLRTVPGPALLALCLAACDTEPLTAPPSPAMAVRGAFPDVIPLPNGFWPEGITFGAGSTFYVSSLATGAIFRSDVRSGSRELLVAPEPGVEKVGLRYDAAGGRLFAAAGFTGKAFVYDGRTGALLADYQLGGAGSSLVNDVALTRSGAYFTDSFAPVLYHLPLAADGALPAAAETIPITGEYVHVEAAVVGNANGIAATPDGSWLIVANTETGVLYRIDPVTGDARRIAIPGEPLHGDGILLEGRTLYVVEGHLDRIAVVRLNADFREGTLERFITSANLRFPSTIARFGSSLYAVNARFDVPAEPHVEYEVVRLDK